MLSDVCLSVMYIGPKSRTEKPRKTKIGTEVAHVTRESDTTFNVIRSKIKVTRPLFAALTRQAAAAVSMGTCWPWESTATLRVCTLQARSARRREALRRPQREERGRGILWRPPACSLSLITFLSHARRRLCACLRAYLCVCVFVNTMTPKMWTILDEMLLVDIM